MTNAVVTRPALKIITGKENILKEIKLIGTSGAKLQERIKVCALSCIEHIKAHGDNTLLFSLLQAIPSGLRSASFIAYCETFAGVKYVNTDENGKRIADASKHKFKKVGEPRDKVTLANGKTVSAVDQDPLNFAKIRETGDNSDYNGFDLLKSLDNLIKAAERAEKHVKDHPADASKVKVEDDVLKRVIQLRNSLIDKRNTTPKVTSEIVPADKARTSTGATSRRRTVNFETIAAGTA